MSVLKISIKFLVIVMIIAITSCKKNSSISPYVGNWKGTYTGTMDNGDFSVNVDNSGNVSGSITSAVFTQTYETTGTVSSNGQITLATGTTTSGAVFTGTLTGNTGKGTWINNGTNPPFSGNWSGNKQ